MGTTEALADSYRDQNLMIINISAGSKYKCKLFRYQLTIIATSFIWAGCLSIIEWDFIPWDDDETGKLKDYTKSKLNYAKW